MNVVRLICGLLIFLGIAAGQSRSKRHSNGCEDAEWVKNPSAVKFPRKYASAFERPWVGRSATSTDVQLYESKAITYNWIWMKALPVRGLGNVTVSDVLDYLESHDCLFIAYGEGVRNLFLGTSKDTTVIRIGGETTCDVFKIYELCRKKFYVNCGPKPVSKKSRVYIGNPSDDDRFSRPMVEPIVFVAWGQTFNRHPTQWEFTANAVGLYDNTAGKVYFIDMTGKSKSDICKHQIALPVNLDLQKQWTGNNLVKVLRYYNLYSDGFSGYGGVHKFIQREIRRLFDPLKFQEYYCRFVYDGAFSFDAVNSTKNDSKKTTTVIPVCRVVNPDARSALFIEKINKTLKEDFNGMYDAKMVPAIDAIDFVNIDVLEVVHVVDEAPTTWPVSVDYDFEAVTPPPPPTTTTEEYPATIGHKVHIVAGDFRLRGYEARNSEKAVLTLSEDVDLDPDFKSVPSQDYPNCSCRSSGRLTSGFFTAMFVFFFGSWCLHCL